MNFQSLNEEVKTQWNVALATYLENIKKSYLSWSRPLENDEIGNKIRNEQYVKFAMSLRVDVTPLYYKVWKGNSIHSFIVKVDGPKFKAGDILKAATYKAPAKNQARGNLFAVEGYHIDWTGADYLR